jgi:hypothetical protein
MSKQGILTGVFAAVIFAVLKLSGAPVGIGITGAIAGGVGALLAHLLCSSKDEEE